MKTTGVTRTATSPIRVRVVYEPADSVIIPSDIAGVFTQLTSCLDVARAVTQTTITCAADRPALDEPFDPLRGLRPRPPEVRKRPPLTLEEHVAEAVDESFQLVMSYAELRNRQDSDQLAYDRQVTVVAITMQSPLHVLLQVDPKVWPVIGFAFVALLERIATMGVRIGRKRREELLRSQVLDEVSKGVREGQLDRLLPLLREPGPSTGSVLGLDAVTIHDPNHPDDPLEEWPRA